MTFTLDDNPETHIVDKIFGTMMALDFRHAGRIDWATARTLIEGLYDGTEDFDSVVNKLAQFVPIRVSKE